MLYKFIYECISDASELNYKLTSGVLQHRMREYEALKVEIVALQTGVVNDVHVNGH